MLQYTHKLCSSIMGIFFFKLIIKTKDFCIVKVNTALLLFCFLEYGNNVGAS